MHSSIKYVLAGAVAGLVTGLFGSGGGMVLIPLLSFGDKKQELFPASIAIMLPICLISSLLTLSNVRFQLVDVAPYLLGGSIGGLIAAKFSNQVPARFLHLFFGGILILGGFRFICS